MHVRTKFDNNPSTSLLDLLLRAKYINLLALDEK